MADFQSSKSAAEIEEILCGSILYTKDMSGELSDAEKAVFRNNIDASPYGEGIKIISHYDSLAELEGAVLNPGVGAAYSVGTETPYNLYVYDTVHAIWVNHGPIRSIDIAARVAQDLRVNSGDWVEDLEIYPGFPYKAVISIGEVTENDLPIVVFNPSEAGSGIFCPVAFTFEGRVEILAKEIPSHDIIVPVITFISHSEAEISE